MTTKLLEAMRSSQRRWVYPQMGGVGLALTDWDVFEVYRDPRKQLEIARRIEEAFPSDFTYVLDFGGAIFQDALGLGMKRPRRDFPTTIEHPYATREELLHAHEFDVEHDGLFSEYLRATELIRQSIDKPHMTAVLGPLTLACDLAGIDVALRAAVRDEGFFRALLEYSTRQLTPFVQALARSGADVVQVSEPAMVLVSPRVYESLALPYLKRLMQAVNDCATSALHVCGDTEAFFPQLVDSGASILSLDQVMDMAWALGRVSGDVFVAGNIDPVETMLNGSPDEVTSEVKRLLTLARGHDNYLVSFGCDCPIETPVDNLKAVMRTVQEAAV